MRTFAFLYAIIFLVFGIAGFIPYFLSHHHLFLAFRTNFWLNCLHIITGLFAAFAGFVSQNGARLFFQIAGVVYAALGLLGFLYADRDILGLFASNSATTWFHVIAAIGALILGYGGNTEDIKN